MFPNLLSIGPFSIHTYGLFVAIGLFAGLMITVRIGKTEGIAAQRIMDMGFIMILSTLLGSRSMYVLMNLSRYCENPLDVLRIWQGGLVFSGGVILAVAAMLWYSRQHRLSLWKVGDLWSPAVAIGQGIGRIGCFMAGCCFGTPTDLRLGIVFTHPDSLAPLNVPLHPTQIYSAISGFTIFLILLGLYRNRKFEGQIFLWFLILHSTARLFIERFRGDDRGILLNSSMSITQFVTILLLAAAVLALMLLKRTENKSDTL
jgi:phosphatidylglycerol:prolipoprotein diacylglycerol transferase